MVITTRPDPANSDDTDDIFVQATWEGYFGSSLRVYEKKHLFPDLLIDYEDGSDDIDRDPSWLSQMFEYDFIRLIKLTSHNQISQFPQINQQAVMQIKSPFVSIRCWSTIPQWERDNWMIVQPSRHLVLINGYSHQGPWYEGDSHLSYRDPYAFKNCCKDYFNNEILDTVQDLWRNYHFVGNTGRISVFTTRPYSTSIPGLQRIGYNDPRQFMTRNLDYEPLLYYGFCNQYAMYHEHDCNYNPPWDPYDGCPSEAYDTN